MPLLDAVGIRPGEVVACAGAGGKTTLCWRLWGEVRALGGPAVFSTTTHFLEPILPPRSALLLDRAPNAARVKALRVQVNGMILAGSRLPDPIEPPDPNPVAPVRPAKLTGLLPEQIDELAQILSDVTWIVEADGARGRGLKVPAAHEPAIPSRSNCVIVVVSLDAIGQPIETAAHRPEHVASFLGVPVGETVTADHIVRILSDPQAGLKNVPPSARGVAVLNQRDEARPHPQAEAIAAQLADRYERVVIASLRAPEPVLSLKI